MEPSQAAKLRQEAEAFAARARGGALAPDAGAAAQAVRDADRDRVERNETARRNEGIFAVFMKTEKPMDKEELAWLAESAAVERRQAEAQTLSERAWPGSGTLYRTGAFSMLVKREKARFLLDGASEADAQKRAEERCRSAVDSVLGRPNDAAAVMGMALPMTNLDVLKAAHLSLSCAAESGSAPDMAGTAAAMNVKLPDAYPEREAAEAFAASVETGRMAPGAQKESVMKEAQNADRERLQEEWKEFRKDGVFAYLHSDEPEPATEGELAWQAEARAVRYRREEAQFLAGRAASPEEIARTGAFGALARQGAQNGMGPEQARKTAFEAVKAAAENPGAAAALLGRTGENLSNLEILKAASMQMALLRPGENPSPEAALAAMKAKADPAAEGAKLADAAASAVQEPQNPTASNPAAEPQKEQPKPAEPQAEKPKAEAQRAEMPRAAEPQAEKPRAEAPKSEKPRAARRREEAQAESSRRRAGQRRSRSSGARHAHPEQKRAGARVLDKGARRSSAPAASASAAGMHAAMPASSQERRGYAYAPAAAETRAAAPQKRQEQGRRRGWDGTLSVSEMYDAMTAALMPDVLAQKRGQRRGQNAAPAPSAPAPAAAAPQKRQEQERRRQSAPDFLVRNANAAAEERRERRAREEQKKAEIGSPEWVIGLNPGD